MKKNARASRPRDKSGRSASTSVYPESRIIGFEPDPEIFRHLEENVAVNHLEGVELVQAAIAGSAGNLTLYSDQKYASHLSAPRPADSGADWTEHSVPTRTLRQYLAEPVDFLKMNIEGAERDVLAAAGDSLRSVRELVIEYHHLPGLPRTLHDILTTMHGNGFEYIVSDYYSAPGTGLRPPFRLTPDTRYFSLVYGRRAR